MGSTNQGRVADCLVRDARVLQDYPYALDLGPGIFIAATAAVLVVAVLTTCSQTLRAAWSSPVDALRHE